MTTSTHTDARRACVDEAIALSESLCAAAKDGDWERVRLLAPERDRLVRRAAVDLAGGPGVTPRGMSALLRLKELDTRLLAVAVLARDAAASRSVAQRKRAAAARTYATTR